MISRVGISVSKGRPKRKIRPTSRDVCVPVSPSCIFSRARTNSWVQPLNLYLTISDRKCYHKVLIFFKNAHRKANDNLFRFLMTSIQSLNYTNRAVRVHVLYCAVTSCWETCDRIIKVAITYTLKKKRHTRAREADESSVGSRKENSFIF